MPYSPILTAFKNDASPHSPLHLPSRLDAGGEADQQRNTVPVSLEGRVAISIADAAAVLGVGRTTLYRLLKDAKLKSIRIGRRNLVLASSVIRLIEGSSDAQ